MIETLKGVKYNGIILDYENADAVEVIIHNLDNTIDKTYLYHGLTPVQTVTALRELLEDDSIKYSY